ncbi:MAG TPA: polysaccharide biosynthesis tyrosine autokinase [Conexibacter sp.]|nr:polysaccharide biosynthesis tyrosine autokinase [Conexibacter sp.]
MAGGLTPAIGSPEATAERESLSSFLDVMRRRWPLVLGIVLACIVAAVARYETSTRSYDATASVAFGNTTLTQSALQVQQGSGDPARDAATNVLIASSRDVAQAVRTELRSPASPETLQSAVSVEAAPNADVINITASTDNAIFSARLANAFADQYLATETQSQLASIDAAQADLQRQINASPPGSAARLSLEQSSQRLDELRAIASGGLQIITRASPPSKPSGTSLKTTVVLGLLVGLALSGALVFLLESLDRRVNSVESFERGYRLPVLATVPPTAFKHARAEDRGHSLEPYRILRSALDFIAVTRQLDTLLITSAVSGEGKSTVSIDLGHAMALAGRRVVVVELDLRQPSFSHHFALDPRRGVTTVLTGQAELGDVMLQPLPALPNLSLLPAGELPPNPSELLSSPAVSSLLADLASDDTIVVIDAPPLNPVADAQVLLNNPAIHAALIVARLGYTTRDQVQRARAILDRHMLQPVGLVVTGVRGATRYGYDAYGPTEPALPRTAEALPPLSGRRGTAR